MICPICTKEIYVGEKFMYPIEVPYVNLWIHKTCRFNASNIIRENPQIVYNYLETLKKKKK